MSSLNLMMVQLKHTQSDIHIFFLPNLKQITCIEYPCTQLSLNNSFASNLRPSDGLQVQPKKEISHMVIPLQRKLYTYTLRNPKLFVLFTFFFFSQFLTQNSHYVSIAKPPRIDKWKQPCMCMSIYIYIYK